MREFVTHLNTMLAVEREATDDSDEACEDLSRQKLVKKQLLSAFQREYSSSYLWQMLKIVISNSTGAKRSSSNKVLPRAKIFAKENGCCSFLSSNCMENLQRQKISNPVQKDRSKVGSGTGVIVAKLRLSQNLMYFVEKVCRIRTFCQIVGCYYLILSQMTAGLKDCYLIFLQDNRRCMCSLHYERRITYTTQLVFAERSNNLYTKLNSLWFLLFQSYRL